MMELHHRNGVTLNYHDLQDMENPEQCRKIEASVTSISILFDESHGELLRSPSSSNEDGTEPWNALRAILETQMGCRIVAHTEGYITAEVLKEYTILVLAAPTISLDPEEVEAIVEFVFDDGNALLIANSSTSLYQQLTKSHSKTNSLFKKFGLQFKQLLSFPPEETTYLFPHYLSSEVDRIFLREPVYLEILETPTELKYPPYVVACLPQTKEACLAIAEVEPGYGRVAAISDYVTFTDDYLKVEDCKQLVLNLFSWLSTQNQLDCFAGQVAHDLKCGESTTFSIGLSNPHDRRLEYIDCLLEAEPGVEILEPQKTLRFLPRYGQTRVEWKIKPTQLGLQTLRLTIDSLTETKAVPLFFDAVARFRCVPDFEIDLLILNTQSDVPEIIEAGNTVEVKVILRQKTDLAQSTLQLHLSAASPRLAIERVAASSDYCWRLTALETGECPITLEIGETGQRISRLMQIRPSIQTQICHISHNIVVPLSETIRRLVAELQCGLDTETVEKIPFHLYTPEQYLHVVFAEEPENIEILQNALRVARHETNRNPELVKRLLADIAPIHLLEEGCCIPYDPQLATYLAKNNPYYQEHLAQNFLSLETDDLVSLKQNIAALILHEKYGHGFFFTQTTLGKQLAILFKHGMARDADATKLRSPYPRLLYEQHQEAIQALWEHSEVLSEGFATWVELTVLPHLPNEIAQVAYRRKVFLFSDAESRYERGYTYFQAIHNHFGEAEGVKMVVQAMREAADIDVGITEEVGKIRFGLDAITLKDAMCGSSRHNHHADRRLEQLYEALLDSSVASKTPSSNQSKYNIAGM